jgi:hypothetical protein
MPANPAPTDPMRALIVHDVPQARLGDPPQCIAIEDIHYFPAGRKYVTPRKCCGSREAGTE